VVPPRATELKYERSGIETACGAPHRVASRVNQAVVTQDASSDPARPCTMLADPATFGPSTSRHRAPSREIQIAA